MHANVYDAERSLISPVVDISNALREDVKSDPLKAQKNMNVKAGNERGINLTNQFSHSFLEYSQYLPLPTFSFIMLCTKLVRSLRILSLFISLHRQLLWIIKLMIIFPFNFRCTLT